MRITMVRKTVTREKAFEIISKSIDKYADHALKDANNAERSTLKERSDLRGEALINCGYLLGMRDAYSLLFDGSGESLNIVIKTTKRLEEIAKYVVDNVQSDMDDE